MTKPVLGFRQLLDIDTFVMIPNQGPSLKPGPDWTGPDRTGPDQTKGHIFEKAIKHKKLI